MQIKKINFNIEEMTIENKIKKLSLFGYKCFYCRGSYFIELDDNIIKEFIEYEYYKEFINKILSEQIKLLFDNMIYDSVRVDATEECKIIDCRKVIIESTARLDIDIK